MAGHAPRKVGYHKPQVSVGRPDKVDIKGIPNAVNDKAERWTGYRAGRNSGQPNRNLSQQQFRGYGPTPGVDANANSDTVPFDTPQNA